ncbi:MAG: insulinase family protein [Elusimicrobiota bacterium]|nr:MAG: insulinase family protein [Elusimicrobiota bacterium]
MKRSLLLVALLLAAPSARALTYSRHVLSNGLTVLLYKDASAPLVAVNIWYKVGSKNEEAGRTGFAHLFEHYMFECTKNTKQGEYFDTVFKKLGGLANAFTSYDKTNYYSVVPAGGLDEMLRLESDRMGFLQACMSQESLDKQRGIVQNEKREREGAPYSSVFEDVVGQTFPAPHPYNWPIIGSMRDLEAASLQDVAKFHKTYYLPNNAVLAIAGAIDEAKALERAKFWFEGIPAGPAPAPLNPPAVASLGGRREMTTPDPKAQMPMLVIGFPIPGRGKPGADEASVLASILSEGRGARLAKALKEGARPLAVMAEGGVIGLYESDLLLIQAVPAPGVTMAELEAAIHAEIARIAAGGPSAQELARVKAKLRTSMYDALQNVEGVAQSLAEGEAVGGDPELFIGGEAARIQAVDADAVKRAAARLTPSNSSVVKIAPAPAAPRNP